VQLQEFLEQSLPRLPPQEQCSWITDVDLVASA